MAAVANNPKFAKQVGIPQSVGKDYVEADKGRKFRSGGMAGCGTKKMAVGGMAMSAGKGYKAGGPLKMVEKDGEKVPFFAADGKGKMNMGGKVAGYKKGGCVRGDGICKKGHTKGRMV